VAVETTYVPDTRAQQILVNPELYAEEAYERARRDVERQSTEEHQRSGA
jgi:parvulin-like peptidyl-prolyl isomerase